MPYKVYKNGDQYCVHQVVDGKKGPRVPSGCYDAESDANARSRAMNSNVESSARKAESEQDPRSGGQARERGSKGGKRSPVVPGRPFTVSAAEESELLVTIPGVELAEVGEEWHTATGIWSPTVEDFQAAIAAQADPAIKSPRFKLGHIDPRFDGEPVFGKFINLRTENNEQTLVADLAGVPKWMADILPTAWPNRSIEGDYDVETATGKKHKFVVTAVAALGVQLPAVETLEDLKSVYEEGTGVEVSAGHHVMATRGDKVEGSVSASLPLEDIRRAYFEQLAPEQQWWWIRTILIDDGGAELIVDDDDGQLYRVPVSIDGESISFDDSVPVKIQYVDDSSGVAASGKPVAIYASRSESRPEATRKENQVELTAEQLQKLGLSEDASEEEVNAKLEELTAETPPGDPSETETEPPEGEPSPEQPPEGEPAPEGEPQSQPQGEQEPVAASSGTIPVDRGALAELQRKAAMGEEARKRQLAADRDRALTDAVKAGKIPPSSKDHYKKLWDTDPEGTKKTLASLAEGVIPVDERGGTPPDEQLTQEAYPAGWLPEVQRRAESNGDRVTQEVS